MTLVSAHPGTGKTVLLANWAAARSDVAWLTLDRDDNWSPRFWHGVERALDRVAPRPRASSGQPPRDRPVAGIIRRLGTREAPVVLVLDDLHEIESPIVLRELEGLLAHASPPLHVVLATRADPSLRLQRLRLAGELAEIRAAELAFTPAECRELLGSPADELSDGDVETLWVRTEGWAAGVRLAALSLEREEDPSRFIAHFAGDERAVADYLLTEILDRQPHDRRRFLLRTCVPETLTAELAADLSGDRSAGLVLAQLESENFLVSTQDERGAVYRFHALLRTFLRVQLGRADRRDVELLNRRCARWYRAGGEAELAFVHAVAGRDWDLADELTAEAWHVVVVGAGTGTWDAAAAVPFEALDGRPGLAIRGAAGLLAAGDRAGAESVFDVAVSQLLLWPAARRARLAPLVEVFRIGLARLDGDYDQVRRVADELAALPVAGGFETGRRAAIQRALALTCTGAAQVAAGELDEAEGNLQESLAVAQRTGVDIVALNSLSELALLESARGRLRRAVEYGGEAVEFARRRGWTSLHHLMGARLALAWAYFNWDELAAARQHADDAADAAHHWGDRTGKVGAAVLAARVLAAEGPEAAATGLRGLRGIRAEVDGWTPPVWLAPLLETAEARVLAACGDLSKAEEALDARGEPAGRTPEDAVIRARLLLASGSTGAALGELEASGRDGDEVDLPRRIEARVLEAVGRRELGDGRGATQAIDAALALAGPSSYRRQFVDGGPPVQSLLVEQIRRGTSHRALVADLIAAFERRAPTAAITRAELLEPLSRRERAVLRYLPTMMSNAEIASELFISVNTVKTHLKSVYRKLGTTRRRDAVEVARRLDLL